MRALLSGVPVRPVGRQGAERSDRRGADRYARRSMTAPPQLPAPTWFVGCGNMGSAIVDGWRVAGIDLTNVTVIRPSGKAVEGARTVRSPPEAGVPPKLQVLAIEPPDIDGGEPELKPWITADGAIVA